jgi:hypothetical protein
VLTRIGALQSLRALASFLSCSSVCARCTARLEAHLSVCARLIAQAMSVTDAVSIAWSILLAIFFTFHIIEANETFLETI